MPPLLQNTELRKKVTQTLPRSRIIGKGACYYVVIARLGPVDITLGVIAASCAARAVKCSIIRTLNKELQQFIMCSTFTLEAFGIEPCRELNLLAFRLP